jgi:CubicO group peptidase (beta-lactamase class C family)
MIRSPKFIQSIAACSMVFMLLTACSPSATPAEPTPTNIPPTPEPTTTPEPTATPTRVPLPPELQTKADQIDAYYTQLTQDGKFSGTVLIEYQGKILLDKGYGLADRQKGTPNTSQTRHRLLNASKSLTAIGILLLDEQGKLKLTDPICSILDDCPEQWKDFTIENLLTGISGLHDYTFVTPIKKTWDQPITREDFLTLLKSVSMDVTFMGPSWEGATDYALLALIIERVSGESYEDFIQNNVFDTLGLANTGFIHGQGEEDDLAIFYTGKDAEPTVPAVDMSNLVGYGSAYSSAEDLVALMRAIQDGSLLSKENTTRMLTPNEHQSGFGWLIYELDENTWVTNFIGLAYTRSQQAIYAWTTNGDWAQVVLSNQQDVNTVLHPQNIACLPGHPGGEETYIGFTQCIIADAQVK